MSVRANRNGLKLILRYLRLFVDAMGLSHVYLFDAVLHCDVAILL